MGFGAGGDAAGVLATRALSIGVIAAGGVFGALLQAASSTAVQKTTMCLLIFMWESPCSMPQCRCRRQPFRGVKGRHGTSTFAQMHRLLLMRLTCLRRAGSAAARQRSRGQDLDQVRNLRAEARQFIGSSGPPGGRAPRVCCPGCGARRAARSDVIRPAPVHRHATCSGPGLGFTHLRVIPCSGGHRAGQASIYICANVAGRVYRIRDVHHHFSTVGLGALGAELLFPA